MASPSSPRIRLWPPNAEGPPHRSRPRPGFAMPMVAFLSFILAGICFGMIMFVQAHVNMVRFGKFSSLADYASENGIKLGFHRLFDLASGWTGLTAVADRLPAELRSESSEGFAEALAALGPDDFPLTTAGSGGGLSWRSETGLSLDGVDDLGQFVRIRASFDIRASGSTAGAPRARSSSLKGSIEFLAGRIPLPSIPLALSGPLSDDELVSLMAANSITILKPPGSMLGLTAAAGEGLVPRDIPSLLAEALDMNVFKPQEMSAARLRAALGLEVSGDPIPDGVYAVNDDLGLRGVFVQGNASAVIPAVDGQSQAVLISTDAGDWVLRYSPGLGTSSLTGPDGTRSFDTVCDGYLIINGAVASLGGGYVSSDGDVLAAPGSSAPSILNGAGLTIVSSAAIDISSSLVLQGAERVEGFPYLKNTEAQLVICSAGSDLISGEARDGTISIDEDAPSDLKLQGSLTSAGGAFEVQGRGKTVEIAGGVHVVSISCGGNALRLAADVRLTTTAGGALTTRSCFLGVSGFRPTVWKEGRS